MIKEDTVILPTCCLITEDENGAPWCDKIQLIRSHKGFKNKVKFCSDPFKECPYMSEAKMFFQEKDRVKYWKK